jgi:His-Xaa-Ser system protein HxsD
MTAELRWARATEDGVSISVDLAIYSLDAVLRTCHAFTARCYLFAQSGENGSVTIDFALRDADGSLRQLVGEFSTALLDQQLRATIAAETSAIRELLVAQAFCEADLLDRSDVEGDEYDDPRRIVR